MNNKTLLILGIVFGLCFILLGIVLPKNKIEDKIEEVLVNNEPRIQLTGIVINGDDFSNVIAQEEGYGRSIAGGNNIDSNRLDVEIFFNIIGMPSPQTVSMSLQRLR